MEDKDHSPMTTRWGRRTAPAILASLGAAILVATAVSPSWASPEAAGEPGSQVVGGFGIGDELEATIGERDGSFEFTVSAGGLALAWESGAAGSDRWGFGDAWTPQLGHLRRHGGVEVVTASGERYTPDPTSPSGLTGHTTRDAWFQASPGGQLEERADAFALGEHRTAAGYEYELHELGGIRTVFNDLGDPIARMDATEARTDWLWATDVPHRLVGVINPDGVLTTLDWTSEPGTVLVTPAANLPSEADPDSPGANLDPRWRIEFDGDRLTAITDPTGGRVSVAYNDLGLIEHVAGVAGATTEVSWQALEDGVPRVDRVRTTDASGTELSARNWSIADGDGLPSGWPQYDGDRELFWSGDPGFQYRTVLDDGATHVESRYNSLHALTGRTVAVRTGSGELVVQEHTFEYPGTEGGGVPDPADLPGNWSRPSSTTVTFHDALGGSRSTAEHHTFDLQGRMVERIRADGTVETTRYDDVVPDGAILPIGLPVEETTHATDGLIAETTHTLNAARTAVIATETRSGREGEDLVTTGRDEFTVEPDGFVTERRTFPDGDASAAPRVTGWTKRIDLASGQAANTETAGAGTTDAATAETLTSLRHGGVLRTTSPIGVVHTTSFDVLGREVRSTDPLGNQTNTAYETAQRDGRNAVTTTTPDGVATTAISDALGRLVSISDNIDHGKVRDGHVRIAETRTYPAPGVTSITDAWGATTTIRQDVHGREIATTGPTGLTRIADYDDVANTVTTGLSPTGRLADAELVTRRRYDVSGRLTESADSRADGAAARALAHGYDGFGRPTSRADGALDTSVEYDAYGRAVTTTMTPTGIALEDPRRTAETVVATRRFDGFGASVEKTLTNVDQSRAGRSRALDGLGREVSSTDQLGRVSTTSYTVDGLPTRAVDHRGTVTETEYDPKTRAMIATQTTSTDGERVSTALEHDPVTGLRTAVFDPDDRAGTEIVYAYDAFGNQRSVTYPDGRSIRFRYDEHGRQVAITDTVGAITRYEHDAAGRLMSATQTLADGEPLGRVDYTYDAYSRVTRLDRDTGLRTEYTFTSTSDIESEHTTFDGRTESRRTYVYDAHGDLTQRTDATRDPDARAAGAHADAEGQSGAGTGADELEVTTTRYTYDHLRRLVRSSVHPGPDGNGLATASTDYELTVGGDIAAETVTTDPGTPSAHAVTRSFSYDAIGALTGITTTNVDGTSTVGQSYDAAGNLVHGADGRRHEYDAANRSRSSTGADATAISYAYWADGSRRQLVVSDAASGEQTAIRYYWSGSTLVNEHHAVTTGGAPGDRTGAESTAAMYLMGSGRHARSVGAVRADGTVGEADTFAYVTDRHGNITELADGSGTVERYRYRDYGAPVDPGHRATEPTGNPFGYAGEYTDPDGTQHLWTRQYDGDSMRFTTMDTADMHNTYAYAELNPVTRVDPSGRAGEPDRENNWAAIGMAIAGLVLTVIGSILDLPVGLALLGVGFGCLVDVFTLSTEAMRTLEPEWITEEDSRMLSRTEDIAGAVGAAIGLLTLIRGVVKVLANRAATIEREARVVHTKNATDSLPPANPPRHTQVPVEPDPTGSEGIVHVYVGTKKGSETPLLVSQTRTDLNVPTAGDTTSKPKTSKRSKKNKEDRKQYAPDASRVSVPARFRQSNRKTDPTQPVLEFIEEQKQRKQTEQDRMRAAMQRVKARHNAEVDPTSVPPVPSASQLEPTATYPLGSPEHLDVPTVLHGNT